MIWQASRPTARALRGIRFGLLALVALFTAHDAVFLAEFGFGDTFAAVMRRTGHDGYWPAYMLLVGLAAALLAAATAIRIGRRSTLEIGLDLLPGRPGLNRFGVVFPGGVDEGRTVALHLQRLDQNVGESRIELRRAFGAAATAVAPGTLFVADGGLLPAGSQWEASAVVLQAGGTEVTRQRFTYTMGPQGVTRGRAAGPIDPSSGIALVLLATALLALSFAVGGGTLPRAEPVASRAALLAGGTAAGLLALALLVAGIDT